MGNEGEEFILIEDCKQPKAVTILARGGNKMACEETITSLIDSMWVVRDCLLDNRLVIGGGATEVELYRSTMQFASQQNGIERYVVRAWGSALLSIPSTLAENSGLPPMDTINQLISDHEKGMVNNGKENRE
jgi:chaperonin GroEL (HSP60 family)